MTTDKESRMAYYKTNDPAVSAAWTAYVAKADELQKQGEDFAAMFPNAKPLFSTDIHSGRRFFGLSFTPTAPQPLWTKPDPKCGNVQRPRSSLPAGIKGDERKALKAELDLLAERYKANAPKAKADLEPFLAAMGLGGGRLFFAGYKQVITDDWVYIETTANPGPAMTEILGSEFEAVNK